MRTPVIKFLLLMRLRLIAFAEASQSFTSSKPIWMEFGKDISRIEVGCSSISLQKVQLEI